MRTWGLNLKVRLIGETLFTLLFWMYYPFLTIYFSDSFGKSIAGLLMSVPPLISVVGNLLGGYLSDSLGRRQAMLSGTLIQVFMFALFALSLSDWTNYIAYILISFGRTLYYPASNAMVADLTPEKERREVFAVFLTAFNIGAVFGPMLGSIFFFHYRSTLLWTCTAVIFLYFCAIFLLIKESSPSSTEQKKAVWSLLSVLKTQVQNYKVIFYDKIFALYILAGVIIMIAIRQENIYLPIYISAHIPVQTLFSWKGWSLELGGVGVFGWMMGLSGLIFVLFVIPVARWFKKFNDRNMLIGSVLIIGISLFMMSLTTSVWLLLVLMTTMSLGELMQSPVSDSFVSKYAPSDKRGMYMGAATLQNTIGNIFAPITIILSGWLPSIGVFGLILLCTLVGAFLYALLFQISDSDRKENTKFVE